MTLIVLEPGEGTGAPWRITFFTKEPDGPRLASTVEAAWPEARAIVINFGDYVTSLTPAEV
jgi:hypothetical protein